MKFERGVLMLSGRGKLGITAEEEALPMSWWNHERLRFQKL